MGRMLLIVVACFIVVSSVLAAADDVTVLIGKLDSDSVEERNTAYEKLLRLAKSNEEVLSLIKKESESPSRSFNTKFFLKKIVKEIEMSKDNDTKNDNIKEMERSGVFGPIVGGGAKAIQINFDKNLHIGIVGIDVNSDDFLTKAQRYISEKYKDKKEFMEKTGLKEDRGVFLIEVAKGSPADGKLKVGDIILKMGDREIVDFEGLKDELEKNYKVGDVVKFEVLRDKSIIQVEVRVGSQVFLSNITEIEDSVKRAIKRMVSTDEEEEIKKIEKKLSELEKKLDKVLEILKALEEATKR